MQEQSPFIIIVSASLIGLIIGSFLNSCVYRIPRGISLFQPRRSICPSCNNVIPFYFNIPVLSYLFLKGRCANCRSEISLQYPLIELCCSTAFSLSVWGLGMSFHTILMLILGSIFLMISLIDWQHFRIPNILVVFAGNILIVQGMIEGTIVIRFLAGLFAGALLIAIRLVGNHCLKRESMGLGDVKLGITMGMALGITGFLLALFLASTLGLLFAVLTRMVDFGEMSDELPFGTFLATATILLLYSQMFILSFF